MEIREEIASRGWQRVVAFQTRNPMHRAHEELCRMAMQDLDADGILIHMLLGKLKAGDIPADVRDNAIRTMVDHYFPENTVMVTGYGFDMLYAGHVRRFCTRYSDKMLAVPSLLLVGTTRVLAITTVALTHRQYLMSACQAVRWKSRYIVQTTAYSKKLDRVVMMKDAPDHDKEDFISIVWHQGSRNAGAGYCATARVLAA